MSKSLQYVEGVGTCLVETSEKIEALPFECPLCDTFPFATAAELGEHVTTHTTIATTAFEQHRAATLTESGKFETVDNGFGGSTTRRVQPIEGPTEKQQKFYAKLVDERRDTFGSDLADEMLSKFETLSKRAASAAIDAVLAVKIERKPVHDVVAAQSDREPVSVGMYRVDERIYKVQKARTTSNLYAKRLHGSIDDGFSFEYEQGAIRTVSERGVRLTLDEAKAFGRETGTCCVCAAVLTNPESIALGIGPICGGRI